MAEALKVLQSIDEIAHQIGTVATLVGMHDELGDKQGAMKVFDSAIKFWEAKVRSGVVWCGVQTCICVSRYVCS